jgi:hypothetical protein
MGVLMVCVVPASRTTIEGNHCTGRLISSTNTVASLQQLVLEDQSWLPDTPTDS